jgi:hypothetical protein
MNPNVKMSVFVFALLLLVLYVYEVVFVLKKDEQISYTQFFFEKGMISFIISLSMFLYNSKTADSIDEPVHLNTFDD